MRELDRLLPDDLNDLSIRCGGEFVLPYAQTLRAIRVATEHRIAILGLEAFEVQKEGLLTVGMADASSYIPFKGDWGAYVVALNDEAERWVRTHRLGENHGYILTSASQKEFLSLKVLESP